MTCILHNYRSRSFQSPFVTSHDNESQQSEVERQSSQSRRVSSQQVISLPPPVPTVRAYWAGASLLFSKSAAAGGASSQLVEGFDKDLVISNALIDVHSRCGDILVARKLFDGLVKKDSVSWNVMINGYGFLQPFWVGRARPHGIQIYGRTWDSTPNGALCLAGRWIDADRVKSRMEERRLRKLPGFCLSMGP
ncbi:hypothetical protein M0R45_004462 [Rubus argutus]|uniref:Pentatricopeptide repeat-containing protein n=1 Tax=Rubus argutus TaxID=59490 RepID=A0AAW1YJY1_RUBAR